MNNNNMDNLQLYARLRVLYRKCIEELKELGIPFSNSISLDVNFTALTRWGQCSKRMTSTGNSHYTITISADLLKNGTEKGIMQTIHHEILHTCNGCMNHKTIWKRYADIVNNAYGYEISRTNSAQNLGYTEEQIKAHRYKDAKYILQCKNESCNVEYVYKRKGTIVKEYKSCRCGRCHSELKLITL